MQVLVYGRPVPVLVANGITQSYGTRVVLGGVDIAIDDGICAGLVGDNGSGKSTLIRILSGQEKPDGGEVVTRGDARIAVLSQDPQWTPGHTALQAAMSGLARWQTAISRYHTLSESLANPQADTESLLAQQGEALAEIERLGGFDREPEARSMLDRLNVLKPDQRVVSMSGGEQRRVALARALLQKPDLLILDEPTNHLDVETIEWLEEHLTRDQPGAVLLVTHDRYFLDRIAEITFELSGGTIFRYEGGYSQYLEAKAEREAHEDRVERNRQNFLRRELEWLRRSPSARRTKQKARIGRAEAALDRKPSPKQRTLELSVDTVRSGHTILELEDLCIAIAERTLIDGLTMYLTKGERVGIVGPNGSGKTTLLRTLLGEVPPKSGSFRLGQNTKVSYLGQDRGGLDLEKSVAENVAGGHSHVRVKDTDVNVRSYLERFLFSVPQQAQPVNALSGGEKTRVLLAKLLLEPTNLLILDEPTNDLDVSTISSLEQMLLDMDATALVVTHDRYFLDRIATAILAFDGKGGAERYEGNYSTYRALRSQRRVPQRAVDAAPAAPNASQDDKMNLPNQAPPGKNAAARKKLTYAERLELEKIVDEISALEQSVEELEQSLSDPAFYAEKEPSEARALSEQLQAKRAELEAKIMRWSELEERSS